MPVWVRGIEKGFYMDEKESRSKDTIRRIGGYLHRVVPVKDATGKVLHFIVKPIMVEFRPRDLMQVIVGASILAIPLAFTEETWVLGERLPLVNVVLLSLLSLLFISIFVYFNFYRFQFKEHRGEYVKRVLGIYIFSLIVVGAILTIIEKCPWTGDPLIAVKRIIVVAFPASMSATVSDMIK